MTFAKPTSVAPKKPSSPSRVRPDFGDPFADFGQDPQKAPRFLGMDLRGSVELADLLEQADFVAARPDNLGATVADGAIDDPCADRIHSVDFGQVDGERVRKRVDFALRRRGARDRQRAGDPVNRAVRPFPLLPLNLGHKAK